MTLSQLDRGQPALTCPEPDGGTMAFVATIIERFPCAQQNGGDTVTQPSWRILLFVSSPLPAAVSPVR